MATTPMIKFNEPFFGYKMDAQEFHDGRSEPITDSVAMQEWISQHIEAHHELRFTDVLDHTVMKIVQGRMVFPALDNGHVLVWDKEKKDWGIEAPPPNEELQTHLSASRAARGPGGRFMHCIQCMKPFTDENVKTPAGWKETQISGFCETCFDELFAGGEDDDVPAA